MASNKPDSTARMHGHRAIENRCKIILERKWPQHEIDIWLGLLSPAEREYAAGLLQGRRRRAPEPRHIERSALTHWRVEPVERQPGQSDAEYKRALWQHADENRW